MEDRCLICGAVIPEGRQVCPTCERGDTGKRDRERVIRDLKEALRKTEKHTDYDFVYIKVDRARTILRVLQEGGQDE